jgi:hypothetical protein
VGHVGEENALCPAGVKGGFLHFLAFGNVMGDSYNPLDFAVDDERYLAGFKKMLFSFFGGDVFLDFD